MSEVPMMRLYETLGNRRKAGQHVVVLYMAENRDWTWRNRQRNGNGGPCIAEAAMTPAAEDYCAESKRASSLQYGGTPESDLSGLRRDLESFALDAATVDRFCDAARKAGLQEKPTR